MKRVILGVALLAMAGMLAACGGASSTGSSTDVPSISTISELPSATSPMATSGSASISKDFEKAAQTGVLLNSDGSAFTSGKSMGACQMFNKVRMSVRAATQADMILCYVKEMAEANIFALSATGQAIDVYDGDWHVFNLDIKDCRTDADCASMQQGATCNSTSKRCEYNGSEMGGSPGRVKMRIQKTAGKISSFEMFMCKKNADDSYTQNEYIVQNIDGSDFGMTGAGTYTSGMGNEVHRVVVTGELNSGGSFTTKTITTKNSGSWGGAGNENWGEGSLEQTMHAFEFVGYEKGTFSQGSASGSYTNRGFSAGEMLGDDSASVSTKLAMGDGAVKFTQSGSWNDGQGNSDTYGSEVTEYVDAWLGDDLSVVNPATGSLFYTTVNAGTLPTVRTSDEVVDDAGLTSNETWDCTTMPNGVTAVDLSEVYQPDMNTACSGVNMGSDWIDCYLNICGPDGSGCMMQ